MDHSSIPEDWDCLHLMFLLTILCSPLTVLLFITIYFYSLCSPLFITHSMCRNTCRVCDGHRPISSTCACFPKSAMVAKLCVVTVCAYTSAHAHEHDFVLGGKNKSLEMYGSVWHECVSEYVCMCDYILVHTPKRRALLVSTSPQLCTCTSSIPSYRSVIV